MYVHVDDNEEDGTEVTQETLSETKEDSEELTELQENKVEMKEGCISAVLCIYNYN